MEGIITAAIVTLAALFLAIRLVKTLRGKVPPCCSGTAESRKAGNRGPETAEK